MDLLSTSSGYGALALSITTLSMTIKNATLNVFMLSLITLSVVFCYCYAECGGIPHYDLVFIILHFIFNDAVISGQTLNFKSH
jgi:hypothetical protein